MQHNLSTKHEPETLEFMQTKYVFMILIGLTVLMIFAAQLLVQITA